MKNKLERRTGHLAPKGLLGEALLEDANVRMPKHAHAIRVGDGVWERGELAWVGKDTTLPSEMHTRASLI